VKVVDAIARIPKNVLNTSQETRFSHRGALR